MSSARYIESGRPMNRKALPVLSVRSANLPPAGKVDSGADKRPNAGLLIVNADDWGRDRDTTDRTMECISGGAVSAVSAMVFMEDSERAAAMACEQKIDAGLHLNFTTRFSSRLCAARLVEHQRRLAGCLLRHRLGQTLFYPGLMRSFEYVVSAQLDEFTRIYGTAPQRLDGHHHMHLCSNVLLATLLPQGTAVRRNFSFQSGEKSLSNRLYRKVVDRLLSQRHRLTDFFFSLPPLEPVERLQRIFGLADRLVVELETHPVNPAEYDFLLGGEIFRIAKHITIAHGFPAPRHQLAANEAIGEVC